MKNSYTVDSAYNDMRLDRWIRNKLGKIPQAFIEKNLRKGTIKVNKKKVKSSYKIKTNDLIDVFNFNFKKQLLREKKKFIPTMIGNTEETIKNTPK